MFLGRISWEATWSLSIRKKVQVDGDEENLKLYATEARQRKRDWSFDGFDRWRFQRLFLKLIWHSTWKWMVGRCFFFPFGSFFWYSSFLGARWVLGSVCFFTHRKMIGGFVFSDFLPKENDPSVQVDYTIFFQMGSKHQNHSFPKYRWILQPPKMWLEVEVWQNAIHSGV